MPPEMQRSVVLRAVGLQLAAGKQPIDLVVRSGEIIGLAGLEGHGQERFLEAMCGLYTPVAGRVEAVLLGGATVILTSLQAAAKAGVVYLPRERKTQGILPVMSVFDNFAIATMGAKARLGFLNRKALRAQLEWYRQRLGIVYASPDAQITSLSGGNQQKVLLARWLAAQPRALLLNDPTRGVDMATKLTLYEVFRETAAQEQTALLLLSTEVEELLQLCDRVIVFRTNTLATELDRSRMTRNAILAAMFGTADEHSPVVA